jgi:hypothetical protein
VCVAHFNPRSSEGPSPTLFAPGCGQTPIPWVTSAFLILCLGCCMAQGQGLAWIVDRWLAGWLAA